MRLECRTYGMLSRVGDGRFGHYRVDLWILAARPFMALEVHFNNPRQHPPQDARAFDNV